MDTNFLKKYIISLVPTFLYTDNGLINEDYQLDSVNFNEESRSYDPGLRQPSDPLFTYTFRIITSVQSYYLRNLKLNEVIGSLGGIINAIFLIGKYCASLTTSFT